MAKSIAFTHSCKYIYKYSPMQEFIKKHDEVINNIELYLEYKSYIIRRYKKFVLNYIFDNEEHTSPLFGINQKISVYFKSTGHIEFTSIICEMCIICEKDPLSTDDCENDVHMTRIRMQAFAYNILRIMNGMNSLNYGDDYDGDGYIHEHDVEYED